MPEVINITNRVSEILANARPARKGVDTILGSNPEGHNQWTHQPGKSIPWKKVSTPSRGTYYHTPDDLYRLEVGFVGNWRGHTGQYKEIGWQLQKRNHRGEYEHVGTHGSYQKGKEEAQSRADTYGYNNIALTTKERNDAVQSSNHQAHNPEGHNQYGWVRNHPIRKPHTGAGVDKIWEIPEKHRKILSSKVLEYRKKNSQLSQGSWGGAWNAVEKRRDSIESKLLNFGVSPAVGGNTEMDDAIDELHRIALGKTEKDQVYVEPPFGEIQSSDLATRISNLLVRAAAPTGNRNAAGPHKHGQPNFNIDPVGKPAGKIKHAVLIIGGKRYRGPSHFQALMSWAKENPNTEGMPNVPETSQGFETESGHFLNREDAADYALGKGLVRKGEEDEAESSGRLKSEQLHLQARSGKLYTQDAVMAVQAPAKDEFEAHRKAQELAEKSYREAVIEATKKREREDEEMLLLFWMLLHQEEAYAQTYQTLATAQGLPLPDPKDVAKEGEAFAKSRQPLLEDFARRFREELAAVEQQASKDGLGAAATQALVRKKALELSGTMATTEAEATYGSTQLALLKRAGYLTKIWVTCEDDKVRPTHKECGEQGEVPIDQAFSNGLQYPGDPNGGPSETCNCRCWIVGGKRA